VEVTNGGDAYISGGVSMNCSFQCNDRSDEQDNDNVSNGDIVSNVVVFKLYDYIFKNALASRYITPEPVPRWLKRPLEFVLQGSNNSLIVLGEDRNGSIGGALLEPPIDIPKQDGNPRFAGAVDIVVGRN
jgi:hypothetical protein